MTTSPALCVSTTTTTTPTTSISRSRLVLAVAVAITSSILAASIRGGFNYRYSCRYSYSYSIHTTNARTQNGYETSRAVSSVVEALQDVVQGLLPQQTMSWQVHASALDKDERSPSEKAVAQRAWQHDRQWKALRQEIAMQRHQATTAAAAGATKQAHALQAMVWDHENDMPLYLERLARNCARNAHSEQDDSSHPDSARPPPPSFEESCWDWLENLISQPRCTTRLDSRFTCQGTETATLQQLTTNKQLEQAGNKLIQTHFGDLNAINVVILGAGPVGLLLANALTTLGTIATKKHMRPVRILVFENRLENKSDNNNKDNYYNGHQRTFPPMKRPYSRNWITDLDATFLENTIDWTIEKFIHDIQNADSYRVPLPINAMETLLLLSGRQRGIKFLYDDYQNYETVLRRVPNLLAFDATGHRLDEKGLHSFWEDQQEQQQGGETNAIVRPWTWEGYKTEEHKDYFTKESHRALVQTNSLVAIAERNLKRGPILYPVTTTSRTKIATATTTTTSKKNLTFIHQVEKEEHVAAQPYVAHMLKINDIRMESADWDRLVALQDKMPKSVSAYCKNKVHSPCRYQQDSTDDDDGYEYDEDAEKTCHEWCGQISVYDSSDFYRSDIAERMQAEQRPTHLGLTVVLAGLTPDQADALGYLLERQQSDVLLQDLPLDRMARMDIFRENEMKRLLTLLSQTDFSGRADVSLFALRPYMYRDPVVPGGLFDNDRRYPIIPLLRIGDSLAAGDPNLGTGLGFHVQVIQKFMDAIKELLV